MARMSEDQRKHLRSRGQFILGNNGVVIRRFLLEHSVEEGLGVVDQNLIDEFLDLSSTRRKPERVQALADILLGQTVEPIVTPGIRQVYAHMKRHEMLRPGIPSALGTLIKSEIRSAFTTERFIGKLVQLFSAPRISTA